MFPRFDLLLHSLCRPVQPSSSEAFRRTIKEHPVNRARAKRRRGDGRGLRQTSVRGVSGRARAKLGEDFLRFVGHAKRGTISIRRVNGVTKQPHFRVFRWELLGAVAIQGREATESAEKEKLLTRSSGDAWPLRLANNPAVAI